MAATATKAVSTAKKTITSVGAGVVKNPYTLLYAGLAIAGIYVLANWAKKLGSFSVGNADGAGGGNNDVNGTTKPFGATITKNQAQNIASQLYEEMVKFFGTDGQYVINILTGLNAKDFAMISDAFGKPRYDGHGEAVWPFPERPLSYWLFSELNDDEIQQLKMVMPGVL